MTPPARGPRSTGPRAAAVLAVAVFACGPAARAQSGGAGTTAGASAALASLWDDETHLGRGAAFAVETSRSLGPHLRVGAEAGWFGHDRDSGYLAASGDVLHLMGRASWLVGPRAWRTRPFIGGGLGVARSSGTFTTRNPFATPDGTSQSWGLTRLAWELQLGVRGAAAERWILRPEVRVGAIGGTGRTGVLETPLLRLQGGVAVEWAPR